MKLRKPKSLYHLNWKKVSKEFLNECLNFRAFIIFCYIYENIWTLNEIYIHIN